jgi:hypothetical protein
MAFQCESCYKDKSAFMWASLSVGPCENCGYTDYCLDLPFDIDPKWKANVKAQLEKGGHKDWPIPWRPARDVTYD